jgi:hypothetical protein
MRSARFGFREETPECTTEHHGRHPVTGNVVDIVTWRCCACGAVTTIERVVNGTVRASKSTPCPCDLQN